MIRIDLSNLKYLQPSYFLTFKEGNKLRPRGYGIFSCSNQLNMKFIMLITFISMFVLCLYVPFNSYGHGGTVSSAIYILSGQA